MSGDLAPLTPGIRRGLFRRAGRRRGFVVVPDIFMAAHRASIISAAARNGTSTANRSPMTVAFRRTVLLDGERPPDDYVVVHEGRTVGRILRMNSTAREPWLWTQITGATSRAGLRATTEGNVGISRPADR